MNTIFAVFEKKPAHGSQENGVIMGPYNTKKEAEDAGLKFGYYGDNYYVDVVNKDEMKLFNFMNWLNDEKKLGYTIFGIERMVKKYLTKQ